MKTIKINSLEGDIITDSLGIRITNVNPNLPLNEEAINDLKTAINKYHLIFLKSPEPIALENQVALTKQLGEPWVYDYIPGQYKDYPEVFKVTNQKGNGFVNAGQAWHSDGSIYNRPMHLSVFSIGEIPKDGASTYFSSLHNALERLPKNLAEKLNNTEALFGKMYKPHAVIWEHPITSKKVLHINEGFSDGFRDKVTEKLFSQKENEELYEFFNMHLWEENTYYEHKWNFGDLVIADNYALAHYAKPTHSNTLRVLHRTATKGIKRQKPS